MTLVGPFIAIALIVAVAAVMYRTLHHKPAPPLLPPASAPAPGPGTKLPAAKSPGAKPPGVKPPGVKPPGAKPPAVKPPGVRPTTLTDYLADDYGLLATAAVARTHADALLVKEHLRTAGIRSTLATAPDGQIRVLVFGDEVVRARRLVG